MRCCVVGLFSLLTALQCCCWFTFSSASKPGVREYYGWSDATLDLLLNWGPIVGLLVQPFGTALLATANGVERAMQISAMLMFGCCALRMLPSLASEGWRRSPAALALVHSAQILNAAAGPLLMSGPSTVSARWFPPEHRGIATALAYCGGNVGSVTTFLLGPLIIANRATRVPLLLLSELVLALVAVVATFALVPTPMVPRRTNRQAPCAFGAVNSAETPATVAPARRGRTWSLVDLGTAALLRAKSLLLHAPLAAIAVIAGVQAGTVAAWQAVLSQQIRPPEYSSTTAGLIGVANSITCLAGNVIGGRAADTCRKHLGVSLSLTYLVAAVCFAFYALSLPSVVATQAVLPWHGDAALLLWSSLSGACQGIADPIAFELAAQLHCEHVTAAAVVPSTTDADRAAPAAALDCAVPAVAAAITDGNIYRGNTLSTHAASSNAPDGRHGPQATDVGASSALSAGMLIFSWNLASLALLAIAPALRDGAIATNAATVAAFALCALATLCVAWYVPDNTYGARKQLAACHTRPDAPHSPLSPTSPHAPFSLATALLATAPVALPATYRFEQADERAWRAHLASEGYVVLASCLTRAECETADALLWDWLEGLGSGLQRAQPDTWRDSAWPGHARFGFLMSRGAGHSAAAWYVRAHPNVVRAFEAIWGTADLLASLDAPIVWRPWWLQPRDSASSDQTPMEMWQPVVERLHCDQNPVTKPGFHCVQGMVPLQPVDCIRGGLQVVPRTCNDETQNYLRDHYPQLHTNGGDDWCELRADDPHIGRGILVEAQPGDLILWDSRTLHGGWVGRGPDEGSARATMPTRGETQQQQQQQQPPGAVANGCGLPQLARASLLVCMTPRERADEDVLRSRLQAHNDGTTLTHWPHTYAAHTLPETGGDAIPARTHVPLELTAAQRRLL